VHGWSTNTLTLWLRTRRTRPRICGDRQSQRHSCQFSLWRRGCCFPWNDVIIIVIVQPSQVSLHNPPFIISFNCQVSHHQLILSNNTWAFITNIMRTLLWVESSLACMKSIGAMQGVVIEFQRGKSSGMECWWMDFKIWTYYGQYASDSVIWSVCFYNQRNIWHPMSKYWSHSERKDFQHSSKKFQGTSLQVSRVSGTTISK